MKKVKLLVVQTYNSYTIDEDVYTTKIKRGFQDWTELSDEEYTNLKCYKRDIENSLKGKHHLEWDEELIIIRETNEEEVNAVKVDLKEVIDSIAKQAKAKAEKEKKRLEKVQKTAEQKKKQRELTQLKKLQEKYGQNNEPSK